MTNWDEKDRRSMNQDQIERDRLLTEVHANMLHIVDWTKRHEEYDNQRFLIANSRISWVEKITYIGIGGLGVLSIILKMIN